VKLGGSQTALVILWKGDKINKMIYEKGIQRPLIPTLFTDWSQRLQRWKSHSVSLATWRLSPKIPQLWFLM
jgi:hypothetical protein